MNGISNDFYDAVRRTSDVLQIKGRVLPVTLDDMTLNASLDNGETVVGESQIPKAACEKHCRIEKIFLKPDKIEPLDYIEGKSDWIDMRASEEVTLKAGEFALIPLGVAMELPKGYEAHLVPRSSTFKNWGIIQTNSVGIVDGSYCGDNDMWRMPVYATRDTVIHVNDRIAQFRIVENQPEIVFEKVEHLTGKDRGGFGSTGLS